MIMIHNLWPGVFLSAALLLAACVQPVTPVTTQEQAAPTGTAAAETAPTPQADTTQIGELVRQTLMQQLGLNAGDVTVVSVEPVDWPDACLGVSLPDVMCAAVITPGYRVVLEANGQQYEYHTDASGSQLMLAAAPEAEVGDVLLEWQQTDVTCQSLRIGTAGLAFGPCMGRMIQRPLPARQQELQDFIAAYAPFQADTPAGAVTFAGQGTTEATPAEQRMIAEWARLVKLEAESGRSGASWGLAFAWHREGGIAGFCDDLTAYVTGQVYASSCKGQTPVDLGMRRLSAAELAQVYAWVDRLAGFEVNQSDPPGQTDAMTVTLVFSGAGGETASPADQQAILDLAATLYAELAQ
jgi:hypothetical protein